MSTLKVLGTIIVDPVTKDMTFYDVDQQPEWVDRVFSMETFDKQLKRKQWQRRGLCVCFRSKL